jgi:hypothetical protein
LNTETASTTWSRASLVGHVASVALFAAIFLWTGEGRATENMLVPGADLSQLVVTEGAWCRYLVLDEALDQEDSTEVYVGLPSRAVTDGGPAFWLEISTKPLNAPESEAQVLKLLVLEAIREFSEGDSLGQYVLQLYIRKGERPAEKTDPATYEDLSLIVPTAESAWESRSGVSVEAAGQRLVCTEKSRTVEEVQEIPTGKVKLIKESRDDYRVWFCNDVPVFHLVKCVVERWRDTETVPRIPGIPVSGSKYSKTTAELTGYGYDAEPILTVDSPNR